MEEQKVILKIFRALVEEKEEGCIIQGDGEITSDMEKNDDRGCEKTLKYKRNSWLLLPPAGEEILCNSEETESGPKVKDDESRNAEHSCKSFGMEREQNKQNERQNAAADWESQQGACQRISDCRTPNCVCAAALKPDDDGGKAKQSLREESEQSDAGIRAKGASETSSSSGPEAGEQHGSTGKPTLEQSAEHFCFENTHEERSGAEEESKNKEIKVFSYHPSSPKDASLNICITPSDRARSPPPGSTISRATYTPGSPTEKHIQLPALFSGLRVLRKGVLGPEHDSVAPLRPSHQRSDVEILLEKGGGGDAKGSILEQISNFLNRDRRGDEREEEENKEDGERRGVEPEEDAEAPSDPAKPVSGAEAAFDAFKAFFTPKPLKRVPGEKMDLDAARKRIKAERDSLRALFEGTSAKSSEQKEPLDHQVGMTCYERHFKLNKYLQLNWEFQHSATSVTNDGINLFI